MCPFDGNATSYATPVIPAQAPDKDAEVRERAAQLIESLGWWQVGGHREGDEPICIVIALGRATPRGGMVPHCGFPSLGAAADWNDVKGRTKAEVIARLRNPQ